MELEKTPTSLVFGVNGERFELSHVDPSTTLLQFLRTRTRFKSVKLGCGEGIYYNFVFNLYLFLFFYFNKLGIYDIDSFSFSFLLCKINCGNSTW